MCKSSPSGQLKSCPTGEYSKQGNRSRLIISFSYFQLFLIPDNERVFALFFARYLKLFRLTKITTVGQTSRDKFFGEDENLSILNLSLRQKSEILVGWGFHPNDSFKKHKTPFTGSLNLNRKPSRTSGTIVFLSLA